jgi:hypothetical protein
MKSFLSLHNRKNLFILFLIKHEYLLKYKKGKNIGHERIFHNHFFFFGVHNHINHYIKKRKDLFLEKEFKLRKMRFRI